mmetsp:Transcript_44389/g.100242  ORF Transcript_44389/g.100242 Transcript_44389/m.100242 type:complete len:410 (+) Transcript_44389:94-1323(+)
MAPGLAPSSPALPPEDDTIPQERLPSGGAGGAPPFVRWVSQAAPAPTSTASPVLLQRMVSMPLGLSRGGSSQKVTVQTVRTVYSNTVSGVRVLDPTASAAKLQSTTWQSSTAPQVSGAFAAAATGVAAASSDRVMPGVLAATLRSVPVPPVGTVVAAPPQPLVATASTSRLSIRGLDRHVAAARKSAAAPPEGPVSPAQSPLQSSRPSCAAAQPLRTPRFSLTTTRSTLPSCLESSVSATILTAAALTSPAAEPPASAAASAASPDDKQLAAEPSQPLQQQPVAANLVTLGAPPTPAPTASPAQTGLGADDASAGDISPGLPAVGSGARQALPAATSGLTAVIAVSNATSVLAEGLQRSPRCRSRLGSSVMEASGPGGGSSGAEALLTAKCLSLQERLGKVRDGRIMTL